MIREFKALLKVGKAQQILTKFEVLRKSNSDLLGQLNAQDYAKVIGANRSFINSPPISIKGKFQHDVLLLNAGSVFKNTSPGNDAAGMEASVFRNAKSSLDGYRVPTLTLEGIRDIVPQQFMKDSSVVSELLAYYVHSGDFEAAESVAREVLADNASKQVVLALMRVLAEGGMSESVEKLFSEWYVGPKSPFKASIDALNALIRAHVVAGNSSNARKYAELAKERYKIDTNAETALILAELSAKLGHVAPVVQMIERLPKLPLPEYAHYPYSRANANISTSAWNLLLKTYLTMQSSGVGGMMDQIYLSMTQTKHVPPDAETLSLMIYGHAIPGQVNLSKALGYFSSTSSLVKLPSCTMFEALMTAFVNAGEPDRAWQLYRSMLSLQCPRRPLSLYPLAEYALAVPERLEESIVISGVEAVDYPQLAKDLLSSLLRVYPKYVSDKSQMRDRFELAKKVVEVLKRERQPTSCYVAVHADKQRSRAYSVDDSKPLQPAASDWESRTDIVAELEFGQSTLGL